MRNSTSSKKHLFKTSAALMAAVLACMPLDARAAVITWQAAPATSDFNTMGNWVGGALPGVADVATFSASSALNPTVSAPITILGVNFTVGGYTLNGNGQLTVTGTLTSGTGVNVITNVALGAVGNQQVSSGGTGSLTLTNITGTGGILMAGSQPLILSGTNTFSGGVTTIGGSALKINSTTALGATAGTFTYGGGSIDNTSGGAVTLANNNAVVINADVTFTGSNALNLGAGATTLGTATGTTRTFTTAASTLTIGGAIANGTTANSIIKSGAGTLVLGGNNTFTGTLSVNAGAVIVNGSNAYTGLTTVTANNSLTIGGANGSLLNTSGFVMASGTTLTLDNTSAGGGNNTNRIADGQGFVFNSNGNFIYKGSDVTNSSETIGALSAITRTTGNSVLTVTYGGTGSADLTAASFNHSLGQAAMLINGTNLGANSGSTSVGRLLLTSGPTLVGTTAATSTGINSAAKDTVIVPYLVGEATSGMGGTGTQTGVVNTFLTYNATTGLRPLNLNDEYSNTLIAGNNVNVLANQTVGTSVAINSLIVNTPSSVSISLGQTLTISSGAVILGAGGGISGAGTLAFGSEAMFYNVGNGTVSSLVSFSGGGLTNSGSNNLTLSGGITIAAGNMTITNASQGSISVSGAISSTGASNLVLNTNSITGTTLSGAVNNQGSITNSGIGTAGTTISGAIGSNVTGLSQNSATSSLTLGSTANTFTGPVSVASGATLSIAGDGSLGNAANSVTLNGGTLNANNATLTNRNLTLNAGGTLAGTLNVAGNIGGTGNLTINGTSVLSGNNTMGGVTVSSGKLYVSRDENLGGASSAMNLNNSGGVLSILGTEFNTFGTHTVTFTGGNSGSFTYDIQDQANNFNYNKVNNSNGNSQGISGWITKIGRGTMTITAAQTYGNSGNSGLGLFGGEVIVDSTAGGSLPVAEGISFGGGTFRFLGKTGVSSTQTVSKIYRLDSGGGTIIVDNNGGSQTTTLNLGTFPTNFTSGAPNFINSGASLQIKTANVGSGAAVATTTTLNTNGIVGSGRAVYTNAAGTTDFATNTTNLSGGAIGGFTGATALVASGSNASVNYSLSGSGSVTATEYANTLKVSGANGDVLAITTGQTLGLGSSGLLFTGGALASDNYSITGGSITSTDVLVHQYGIGSLTINSVVANAGTPASRTGTTNGTAVVTGINTDNLYVGALVSGTGISAGTYIKSIDSANQITLTANATAGTPTITIAAINTNLVKAGPGTLILTGTNTYAGQTYVNSGVLSISSNANISTGQLNLNGGGTLQTTTGVALSRAVVLGGGSGTFDVSDGQTTTVSGTVSGTGGLNVTNTGTGTGILALTGNNTFTGGVVINKGVLQQGSTGALNTTGVNTLSFGAGSTATFRTNGVNATVAGLNGSNTAAILENGGAAASTFTVNNGGTNSYAGTIQNGGAGALNIVKSGSGKTTFSGTNTYGGTTTVNGGTLLVNGTHSGAGAYTVNTGGTLGGVGTINTSASNSNVTIASGGKLSPGTSPGTLTLDLGTGVLDVSGAVGGANTGALVFELGINGSGTSDILALTTGVLNIGSGVLEFSDFNFSALSGFASGTYTLFDTNNTILGSLGSSLTGTVGGISSTLAISGNDLVLNVGAVPEPSTYALIAGGLATLAFLRRRKKD